jgi:dTDP-4-dehydrorhamnose reductase
VKDGPWPIDVRLPDQFDVRGPVRVARVIADVAPSVVVNASSGQSDWAVTADGAVRVALATVEQGCRAAHVRCHCC